MLNDEINVVTRIFLASLKLIYLESGCLNLRRIFAFSSKFPVNHSLLNLILKSRPLSLVCQRNHITYTCLILGQSIVGGQLKLSVCFFDNRIQKQLRLHVLKSVLAKILFSFLFIGLRVSKFGLEFTVLLSSNFHPHTSTLLLFKYLPGTISTLKIFISNDFTSGHTHRHTLGYHFCLVSGQCAKKTHAFFKFQKTSQTCVSFTKQLLYSFIHLYILPVR